MRANHYANQWDRANYWLTLYYTLQTIDTSGPSLTVSFLYEFLFSVFYLFSDVGYSSGFNFLYFPFYIGFVINGVCLFTTVDIFLVYTEFFIMQFFCK